VLRSLVSVLGVVVAFGMALGATFGALNTMYTAVAARSREIATLRALGFQGGPVVISILAESLLLALAGGLLGGGLAYLAVHGYQTATINWQSFSQVAFSLTVTPGLLIAGLAYALLMGFFGGVFPAIRAARVPVAIALRQR
jgi:putative ABC transport system permease protein